eukprot:TRINITY_DN2292_c0_g2_i1.p1 TRINITY_DN2292_c0_g2~~TRINITY_DN2292_c0_g2_i1.p1  ORF type:complete len:289 (+),score=29.01 TRINITY_DN2292_c0_g2_i1:55-921(+)
MDEKARHDYQSYMTHISPERKANFFLPHHPTIDPLQVDNDRQGEWNRTSKAQVEAIASLEQEIAQLELQIRRSNEPKRTNVTMADSSEIVQDSITIDKSPNVMRVLRDTTKSPQEVNPLITNTSFASPASDSDRFDAERYSTRLLSPADGNHETAVFWQQLYWECKRVLGSCKRALHRATEEIHQLQDYSGSIESKHLRERRENHLQLSELRSRLDDLSDAKLRVSEQLEASKAECRKYQDHCRQLVFSKQLIRVHIDCFKENLDGFDVNYALILSGNRGFILEICDC